ncbi:MAG: nucleotidyltransferase domain-containing protein, partial [Candidatus Aenigmatarchaeota archaeon]
MVSNHNEFSEILQILVDTGEKYSIRKLSQLRKINYKSAYNAVMKLEKESIVTIERLGNTNICSFNKNFNQSVFAVEDDRRTSLMKNKDFLVIHKRLSELQFPLIVLLFGSYAKRTTTKHSDIDLLAITENEKEVQSVVSITPLDIHLT